MLNEVPRQFTLEELLFATCMAENIVLIDAHDDHNHRVFEGENGDFYPFYSNQPEHPLWAKYRDRLVNFICVEGNTLGIYLDK